MADYGRKNWARPRAVARAKHEADNMILRYAKTSQAVDRINAQMNAKESAAGVEHGLDAYIKSARKAVRNGRI